MAGGAARANGNDGVAKMVKNSEAHVIGYVEYIYALQNHLQVSAKWPAIRSGVVSSQPSLEKHRRRHQRH